MLWLTRMLTLAKAEAGCCKVSAVSFTNLKPKTVIQMKKLFPTSLQLTTTHQTLLFSCSVSNTLSHMGWLPLSLLTLLDSEHTGTDLLLPNSLCGPFSLLRHWATGAVAIAVTTSRVRSDQSGAESCTPAKWASQREHSNWAVVFLTLLR